MDLDHIFLGVFSEPDDICAIVLSGGKADLTIIATLDDMDRNVCWSDSW
jgi:hypothetical protein